MDDTSESLDDTDQISSSNIVQNRAQNQELDGMDGMDDTLHISPIPAVEAPKSSPDDGLGGTPKHANDIILGFNKDGSRWGIHRTRPKGDNWICTFPKCKIHGDIFAVRAHTLIHLQKIESTASSIEEGKI
jgi:hypothetical protein